MLFPVVKTIKAIVMGRKVALILWELGALRDVQDRSLVGNGFVGILHWFCMLPWFFPDIC